MEHTFAKALWDEDTRRRIKGGISGFCCVEFGLLDGWNDDRVHLDHIAFCGGGWGWDGIYVDAGLFIGEHEDDGGPGGEDLGDGEEFKEEGEEELPFETADGQEN